MQIVIDIPEEIIKDAKDSPNYYPTYHFKEIWKAVVKGIPLPKGHGRILDEKDILNTNAYYGWYYDLVDMPQYIAGVKEIIEADKE